MQGRGPQVETPWSTQYVKLVYLREREATSGYHHVLAENVTKFLLPQLNATVGELISNSGGTA